MLFTASAYIAPPSCVVLFGNVLFITEILLDELIIAPPTCVYDLVEYISVLSCYEVPTVIQ